ncbi:amidohydrolase [Microbacterium mangrovi]|uniref:Amidohydrolase n=1 Tax=Microbacterium mangrovi TaxID=1348253 RepID=A0A0B2A4W2_9MICO|nr:amidohydrolase family protein [Microbacterium mangrovi]KHK96613.1 amidohydrolase [Microbacterium mangrovi]
MSRYEPRLDLDALHAIDMHVHIEQDGHLHTALPADLAAAAARYFRTDGAVPDIDGVAAFYRQRRMAAVVFTVDAGTNLGHPALSSAAIAEGAARNADVLIPFGSVDPLRGAAAVDQARRLVAEHGVRGFKFHPTLQGFDPSDDRHYPLYEAIRDAGAVALFHTGQTGIGAGTPGGHGLRLGLSNPILLDAVAADFPDLQIVMAHPSVPWQDEALSVATHKSNVWIDLSGWSPKYFPAELVRYAGSILKDRVLFGTDFPLLTPDRWLADIAEMPLKAEVMPGILKHNAVRLLGLEAAR